MNAPEDSEPDDLPPRRLRLSHLLETERLRRRLSTYDAADIFGVNQSSYYRWEQGMSVPGKNYVPALSEFLGIPVEDIHKLRLGLDDDIPETAEENSLRLRMLERVVEELRASDEAQERKLSTIEDILTRMLAKFGPPGPERRQPPS